MYHWKGFSWKITIDRKIRSKKSSDDNNDDDNDNNDNDINHVNHSNKDDLIGTRIYLNRFSQEFAECVDIKFRYFTIYYIYVYIIISYY